MTLLGEGCALPPVPHHPPPKETCQMPTLPPKTKTETQAQKSLSERDAEAKKPKPEAKKVEREPVYPEVDAVVCRGDRALTYDKMKAILHWETEDEHNARVKAQNPYAYRNGKAKDVGFGDDYLLKDVAGKKVRCWNNTKNRPFSEPWSTALAINLLLSGPGTPKEKRHWKCNGESFIVGVYAQVLSGQHRGVGLMIAVQLWRLAKQLHSEGKSQDFKAFGKAWKADEQAEWLKSWPSEPVLETVYVRGIDESPDTTRTIDNVKPRSLSDVFYTSDVLASVKKPGERAEVTRMLATAVDLMWKRTGVDSRYQTHAESVDFLDRHKSLMKCVQHVFQENKDRAFSGMKLSPGQLACLMYLMAAAKTDPDKYHGLRSEKACDLSLFDQAKGFMVELIKSENSALEAAVDVLSQLVESEEGARASEKRTVLVKAWNLWAAGEKVTGQKVLPETAEDSDGNLIYVNHPSCGGIDLGDKPSHDEETAEADAQAEEERKAVAAERVKELDAKAEEARKARIKQNGHAKK